MGWAWTLGVGGNLDGWEWEERMIGGKTCTQSWWLISTLDRSWFEEPFLETEMVDLVQDTCIPKLDLVDVCRDLEGGCRWGYYYPLILSVSVRRFVFGSVVRWAERDVECRREGHLQSLRNRTERDRESERL